MPARGAGCRTSLLYVSIAPSRKYPAAREEHERASEQTRLDTYVFSRDWHIALHEHRKQAPTMSAAITLLIT